MDRNRRLRRWAAVAFVLLALPLAWWAGLWRQWPRVEAVAVPDLGEPAAAFPFVLLDPAVVARNAERARAGDPAFAEALAGLRAAADAALSQGPFTVTDKTEVASSGDPRDYVSLSIYWWPNAWTAVPYLLRDGRRNPEAEGYDAPKLEAMVTCVATLAAAHRFLGDERHAERAALLLRTWFIDPRTRMNPHLTFAQRMPGWAAGGRQGIIETASVALRLPDALALLGETPALSREDRRALRDWIAAYLAWLRQSGPGRSEGTRANNHGTWYDVQVAAFAHSTGQDDVARAVLAAAPERMARQIRADGSQPEELRRTRSFDYSVYNLQAWIHLARLGERIGGDLWQARGPEGQGLRSALDYLVERTRPGQEWTHEQITPLDRRSLAPLLEEAARALHDEWLADQAREFRGEAGGVGWEVLLREQP